MKVNLADWLVGAYIPPPQKKVLPYKDHMYITKHLIPATLVVGFTMDGRFWRVFHFLAEDFKIV